MRTIIALMLTRLLSQEATAGAAGTAAAPEAAPKAEKPATVKQNGVAKPGAQTHCGRIWAIADAISARENRPAKRSEVIAAADAEGINPSTASTQFGRWHKFWGLPSEPRVAPVAKAEGKAEGKGGKKSAKGATAAEGAAALSESSVEGAATQPTATSEGAQA